MTMRTGHTGKGFTLIELLVVVGIISMLLGLVSVGLRKTSIVSKNLRQKSVFHGMEIGLELFSKDFDGYPDSRMRNDTGNVIVGAQRFAEALVGRDGLGFDPRTDWYAPDDPTNPGDPYMGDESLGRRKDLYLEFKHFEARTLDEFYQTPAPLFTTNGTHQAPILTDVFEKNPLLNANGKVGSPILYFKANQSKREWDFRTPNPDATDWIPETYTRWVYNLDDNRPLLDLGIANQDLADEYDRHFPDTDPAAPDLTTIPGAFYRFITNGEALTGTGPNASYRPYNPNTYLLMSAGYDGIYGTEDDITNFNY